MDGCGDATPRPLHPLGERDVSAWCMAHPWMTFWLVWVAIACITSALGKLGEK
jgi:hypothetical protein